MIHKNLIFVLAFLALVFEVLPQEPAGLSNRDRKRFDQARDYYLKGNFPEAEGLLVRITGSNPRFPEAFLLLGDVLVESGKIEESIPVYKKVLETYPSTYPEIYRIIGGAYFELHDYEPARRNYLAYKERTDPQGEALNWINNRMALCDFRIGAIKNPVPFVPCNLGEGVNSEAEEYVNTLTADEQSIFFTRKSQSEKPGGYRQYVEDFYYSVHNGETWQEALILGSPVDSRGDAGAMTISPDGIEMFFTSCFRADSKGSCDIYYSRRGESGWSLPVNLGPAVNSSQWDSQPSISPDGSAIYFASTRSGGFGKSDIWKIKRLNDGSWSEPENLGPQINSSGREMAPFIHFDNKTLYFASDGHMGMGKLDLFRSEYLKSRGWGEPQNLGYPLNSEDDDIAVIINSRGDKGYLSAVREGGYGNYDIYGFELPEEIRPQPVSYLKGIISDALTGEKLEAVFELVDISDAATVMSAKSSPLSGSFLVCIPVGKDYLLNVSKDGYLFYSEHFALSRISSSIEPFEKNILLQPVREGSTAVLKNVFFEFDRYDLLKTSYAELDRIVGFLNHNPQIRVEIGGHTDNIGTGEYNLELSSKRAEAVALYLLENGISRERITSRGYGSSIPVASNETAEGRSDNRRTEIRIISAGDQ